MRRLAPAEVPISQATMRVAQRRSVLCPSAALTLSSFLRYDQLGQADLLAAGDGWHRSSAHRGV